MIIEQKYFDIKQIADSGQCFRMNQIGENRYGLVAFGKYLEIEQITEDQVEFFCSDIEFETIWKRYFDLEYNYEAIVERALQGEDQFLRNAVIYGKGIRILRQEPFEMLISFIISQNKNIPSIKLCIERISKAYGHPICQVNGELIYSFPTAKQLQKATKEELRDMKLGYRDEYIIAASHAVANDELDLDELLQATHEIAVQKLREIRGIGEKVANCVSLYGLHHIEAFPIDVWMKKVVSTYYNGKFPLEQYQGHAGIIQQYLFYYIRSL